MKSFEGKTCIVTGAASGIGRCISGQLAASGATVFLADCNSALLEEAARHIIVAGGKAYAEPLDVTDSKAFARLVEKAASTTGKLDYLFNNAGIGVGGEAFSFEPEDWERVISVNLYGVISGVQAAYPLMVKQGSGHIVNVASVAGLFPLTGEISYTTSKYAVVGLTQALRAEAADLGVKVSLVCPGKIETPIYQTAKIIGFDKQKAISLLPKGITPENCAGTILKGVAKNKAIIVITGLGRLMWLVSRVSPALSIFFARQYMKKMRTTKV
jgi:NAD(P)-dependent dehydrogenase (short-subunit alcohol dehydrogenase family)